MNVCRLCSQYEDKICTVDKLEPGKGLGRSMVPIHSKPVNDASPDVNHHLHILRRSTDSLCALHA